MKNGLMVVSPNEAGMMNIGDFVQAQAARQYFDTIDILIDRDFGLAKYNGDEVKMIMNGWYMDHPENFPPSNNITPLFVSMHINSYGLPGLLRKECVEYFKKHQPIGCRDMHTVELLKEKGVDAYFTGCLTLTLGRKYKYDGKREGVYIVEPIFSTKDLSKRPKLICKAISTLLLHHKAIKHIARKKRDTSFRSLLHNSIYFREYSKVFDKEILINAEYINQFNKDIAKLSYNERLEYAEKLIQKYAQAELVITSRIHCGLPCLGLETPVIYTLDAESDKMSTERFGGLMELFNTITWSKDNLIWQGEKITLANKPKNKDNWKPLAKKLIQTCEKFIKE
ncbi:MAG: polysaccharide pyruvyl transferase family protein [Clostridium sp.]|nr:polysaccharide pyruvyl transferase family protein [Clostridium sp.]